MVLVQVAILRGLGGLARVALRRRRRDPAQGVEAAPPPLDAPRARGIFRLRHTRADQWRA